MAASGPLSNSNASNPNASKLGIVAGAGALPGLLAASCAASARPCFIIGLSGFADDAALPRPADAWIHLGEFGKGMAALKTAGVEEVVLAGAVRRPALSELMPDLKGAALLAKVAALTLSGLGDDGLLRTVIAEIERDGFRVVGADQVLAELLTPEGILGKYIPDAAADADIRRGLTVAREIGAADVGQAVIVQQGIVLGVEAAEGTDALIARCAALARPGAGGILVKAKKPHQERRADLPTIGPATVVNAARAGLRGIAVEAGHSLILGRANVVAEADANGLFIAGVALRELTSSV